MLATAHKIDDKWVALPELEVDVFFGLMVPNQTYIRENAIPFKQGTNTDNLKENQIVYGRVIHVCDENRNMTMVFKLVNKDGKSYM